MPYHGARCSQCKSSMVLLGVPCERRVSAECQQCGHTWISRSRWALKRAEERLEKTGEATGHHPYYGY